MISEVVFFIATCDRCGKRYCKDDAESMVRLFNSKDEVKEELDEVDWVVGDGVLCKGCYEYNEQLKK